MNIVRQPNLCHWERVTDEVFYNRPLFLRFETTSEKNYWFVTIFFSPMLFKNTICLQSPGICTGITR